ncbi:MAG TPA: hypothetical protein VGC41_13945 [Kofleriaceae bacterium]
MVVERGDLQFFFQPSVQPADADEYKLGVQSLFAILSTEAGTHRRLRIGKKRMPATSRERFWCRIERVGTLQRALGGKLEADRYMTKTRGERFQPAARPVAQGTYELVQHEDHMHFTYQVEPFPFDDAPDELGVAEVGDHLMLFKAKPGSRAVWSPTGSATDLDEEGAQIVLVGRASKCEQSETPR